MSRNEYRLSTVFLKLEQMLLQKPFLQKFRFIFYYLDTFLLIGTEKKIRKREKALEGKKKVLIIYNIALGDAVMFLGVAKHFRDIYPQEQYLLTIACQEAFKDLYLESGIFDYVIPLDFAGSVVNIKKRRQVFKKLREHTYDYVIDSVGCERCTTNIFMTRAAIGRKKIGVLDLHLPSRQCPEYIQKKIYSKVVKIDNGSLHLIEFYAEFLKRLGAKNCVAHPAHLKSIELDFELPKKFFIVFPGASLPVKTWSSKGFGRLAQKVYEKTGMTLVVCGTTYDEPVVKEFLEYAKGVEVLNLIGKTSILQFIEVIGRAALVITNDTSAYHIGVAKQVDTVLLCGGYTYDRYANYQYAELGYKNPVLVHEDMGCENCDSNCIYKNPNVFPCVKKIRLKKAWEAIDHLLGEAECK